MGKMLLRSKSSAVSMKISRLVSCLHATPFLWLTKESLTSSIRAGRLIERRIADSQF